MFEGAGLTTILMMVGFVLAAITVGRALFKRTLFPRVHFKEFIIALVAGTAVIYLIINVPWLGILSGIGLIVFLLLPSILKLKPIRF